MLLRKLFSQDFFTRMIGVPEVDDRFFFLFIIIMVAPPVMRMARPKGHLGVNLFKVLKLSPTQQPHPELMN